MFVQAMDAVERGLRVWREKPHNAKWWRRIDGTPIPNDLCVCIAEEVSKAMPDFPPTQFAYEATCKALHHWRAEALRLGELAGVKPRELSEAERG